MKPQALLDTGPLVAFLNRRDRYHEWSRDQLGLLPPPLYTCEAVLSEALFLLRAAPQGPASVLALVERGLLRVPFRLEDHAAPVARLIYRHAQIPMSLADACLVRMSELQPDAVVLTLDSDFSIYRRNGRQVIPCIRPR